MDHGWVVLGASLLLSLTSSARSKVGTASRDRAIPLTPMKVAFSIWIFIYILILVSYFYQMWNVLPRWSNYAQAASFFLSALWTEVFVRKESWVPAIACLLLIATCVFSLLAAIWGNTWTDDSTWTQKLCVDAGYSLYSGWLLVASTLAIVNWAKDYTSNIPFSSLAAPIVLGIGVACARRDTVLLLPLLWAIALQESPPRKQQVVLLFVLLMGEAYIVASIIFN